MNICMTVEEAAELIGSKIGHVYYLAYMGYIEGWKIRGAWRLFKGSVEAYAQARNQGRTHQTITVDTHHKGCVGIPSLFESDHPPDDLGKPAPSLHGGRRMEHHQDGFPVPFIPPFQPLNRPVQLNLFAEAV